MQEKHIEASFIEKLKEFPNIVIKFGRYIPNHEKHYDEVLGIYLVSNNPFLNQGFAKFLFWFHCKFS